MPFPRSLAVKSLALAATLTPLVASAWWSEDFQQRTKFTLNTSSAGVETREALSGVAVPLRLHSGNFDFLGAHPDGADLRVLAGDDKTPLKFSVERFDGSNELGVLWVQLPAVAPGSDKNTVYVYAGSDKAGAASTGGVFDGQAAAAFHFSGGDGTGADPADAPRPSGPITVERNGLIGPSARLAGTPIEWPASERVKSGAAGAYTLSLWIKPEGSGGQLFAQGPLSLELSGARVNVRLGSLTLAAAADLPANAWAQLVVVLGTGKVTLYLNGLQASQGDLPADAPAVAGPLKLGAGFNGLVDELQVAGVARSAEWVRFMHAAQSADARLIAANRQDRGGADAEGGTGGGYIGILVKNLTLDAKVVIGLLGVMFVIAVWVMIDKARLVIRVDRGNHRFLTEFRDTREVLAAQGPQAHPTSSLARLYAAGCSELAKREIGSRADAVLTGVSLDAVKAAVDADLVRENHRLNSLMVLLTIAISGGPFLGLLGTVVGVMITFAAIAAAGDVNVNAIAPGIAAALLATVAGLAVAIPSLFGYNYLAARIKNISTDMQIFVDEFLTRVAERYGAR